MPHPTRTEWDNIPGELKEFVQWVVWRYEENPKRGKPDKVPYTPYTMRMNKADSTDPTTWGTYGAAITVYEACEKEGRYDGIGFVMSSNDPYVAVDLDHCIDPATGAWEEWAIDIYNALDSYSELSPSGTGVHIFLEGEWPVKGCKIGDIEVYASVHYMTMTGQRLEDARPAVCQRQEALDALYERVFAPRDAPPVAAPSSSAHFTSLTDTQVIERATRAANGAKFIALWRGISSYPSQSEADLALVSILAFYTQDFDQLDRLMRSSELGRRSKWGERADYRNRTINKALQGLANTFGSGKSQNGSGNGNGNGNGHKEEEWPHDVGGESPGDGTRTDPETGEVIEELPTIMVSNRPMRDISLDAMTVLLDANTPPALFVRSAELARVRSDENERPVIEGLLESHMRGRLARVASFVKINSRGNEVHVPPPVEIVRDIVTIGEWPFPPLEAVVEAPTLRPDGTILDREGYDGATRLYYMPCSDLTMPPVPDEPAGEDTARAIALLRETLGEFPYVDDASWANTLGLLMTPVVRAVIKGHVPLALIDAPRAGTGKTMLNDAIALIATGRSSSIMTAPREEEEWRKKITSLLVDGGTIITIDNVEFQLNSSSLAAALTADIVQDRMLSTMRMVRVPQRATWVATGNNIRLGGDIPRRCYWIRLDSQTSRPWTRTAFRHPDLLGWVHLHRGELLAALLTLARAWFAAGRPAANLPVIGSFEEWTRVVGGILTFAGVPGFLGNLNEFWDQTDEEATQWEAFLSVWYECFGEDAITITELCDALATGADALASQQQPELLAALPDALVEALEGDKKRSGGRSFRTRLGKLLARKVDIRYGDYSLKRASDDSHTKHARWKAKKFE